MTPEEHIQKAEYWLNTADKGGYNGEYLNAWANAALAHIEMARYKKEFTDPLWTDA